jgi:uncharacterized protein (TIGR03435 family)
MRHATAALLLTAVSIAVVAAQDNPRLEFDVVSIKRVTELRPSSGFRTLPDGSELLSNISVAGFVREASPVTVREVVGLPEWANTERFDVTVKPPAGATEAQRRVMWRAAFADSGRPVSASGLQK